MEKIRPFERKCLRVCTGLHRNEATQYKHYISANTLYNTVNIPRIDNHIINLTRNYFANTRAIKKTH